MAFTGLNIFDRAVHRANAWLKDLHTATGLEERHRVYSAFVAVIRALRDRLPHDEVLHLGAQLPTILAGAYYAGWRLSSTPLPLRDRAFFLEHVQDHLGPGWPDADPEALTRAVFEVLADRISPGQLEDVLSVLPTEIRELWASPLPETATAGAGEEAEPPPPIPLEDWNVVVTTRQGAHEKAVRVLSDLGETGRTGFGNVLVQRVEDVDGFLEELLDRWERQPEPLRDVVGHVSPVQDVFRFHTLEEFETRAGKILAGRAEELADRSFHVRIHRRGFKGVLSSAEEEDFLGETIMESLRGEKKTATVSFEEPDALVAVETISHTAGVSIFTREDLDRYPFLGPE